MTGRKSKLLNYHASRRRMLYFFLEILKNVASLVLHLVDFGLCDLLVSVATFLSVKS